MRIILERQIFTDKVTLGKMFLDFQNGGGQFYVCDTLEDCYRGQKKEDKIYGQTAIPKGNYKIKNVLSAKFGVITPLLFDVPNYEGVRIHCGNEEADTLGCILVGTISGTKLINSRLAYNSLWEKVKTAKDYEIEIIHKC